MIRVLDIPVQARRVELQANPQFLCLRRYAESLIDRSHLFHAAKKSF